MIRKPEDLPVLGNSFPREMEAYAGMMVKFLDTAQCVQELFYIITRREIFYGKITGNGKKNPTH